MSSVAEMQLIYLQQPICDCENCQHTASDHNHIACRHTKCIYFTNVEFADEVDKELVGDVKWDIDFKPGDDLKWLMTQCEDGVKWETKRARRQVWYLAQPICPCKPIEYDQISCGHCDCDYHGCDDYHVACRHEGCKSFVANT
jgi:hypothetical protein